jgi:hypothetical protein
LGYEWESHWEEFREALKESIKGPLGRILKGYYKEILVTKVI